MGVMIPMKRERMLTIRVTDDEHARLLERCEGKQLAVWMRRDQRKITQGQCQRFVNTDVGVPQGSQQHPAMQIRNIMVQGADFRVSRLYETRKPKTIHVVAQVADVLQQQSLHVRSRIGDSFC
ncbi:TPA: hypothetical protein G7974_004736 [Salmonella enterica]|jgi:hypothetical protein